jgi:hypothetical protein
MKKFLLVLCIVVGAVAQSSNLVYSIPCQDVIVYPVAPDGGLLTNMTPISLPGRKTVTLQSDSNCPVNINCGTVGNNFNDFDGGVGHTGLQLVIGSNIKWPMDNVLSLYCAQSGSTSDAGCLVHSCQALAPVSSP